MVEETVQEVEVKGPTYSDLALQRKIARGKLGPFQTPQTYYALNSIRNHLQLLDSPHPKTTAGMMLEFLEGTYLAATCLGNAIAMSNGTPPPGIVKRFSDIKSNLPYREVEKALAKKGHNTKNSLTRLITSCVEAYSGLDLIIGEVNREKEGSAPINLEQSIEKLVQTLEGTEKRVLFYGWDSGIANHYRVVDTIDMLREKGIKIYMLYTNSESNRAYFINLDSYDVVTQHGPEILPPLGNDGDYPVRFTPDSKKQVYVGNYYERFPYDGIVSRVPFKAMNPNISFTLIDINLALNSRHDISDYETKRDWRHFVRLPILHGSDGQEFCHVNSFVSGYTEIGTPLNIFPAKMTTYAIIDPYGYRIEKNGKDKETTNS